ncbi:MAG TPA: L-2-hydroxyglutarate oxidase [Candidatus Eisenbacteria bacterium]|nr:L-2-hydroxyglutarate oxidase [Candidatus Eisenbacteria bacterium]
MADRQTDLLIIGAGIVGLATAVEYSRRFPGQRLLVVEKEDRVAAHQTGHNSGVIHSGIYYRTGSLKARNCVAGCASMKRFCAEHAIPYEECGKLVVATAADEVPRLKQLHERGVANGVPGLRLLDRDQFLELEPHADGICALHVPTTGIVDYKLVAAKYAELIEQAGGEFVFRAKVTGLREDGDANLVETAAGAFRAAYVINCAGLYSDAITRMAGCKTDLEIIPFRGEYYEVKPARRWLVRNLIYPVPDPRFPFLGVHFTRHIDGSVEAGPNALLAFRREGYSGSDVDLTETVEMLQWPGFWKMARKYWKMGAAEQYRAWLKPAFTRALQQMVPDLTADDLMPGGSGVRAQAVDRNGNLLDDFCFVHSRRMIHVCNVPSPAATASLEIGREVVDMLANCFELEGEQARRTQA